MHDQGSIEYWAKQGVDLNDPQAALRAACVAACKKRGAEYAAKAVVDTAKALADCHGEREQLDVNRLLAKVEQLVDQQELPLERA
jgi:hypothetical protein